MCTRKVKPRIGWTLSILFGWAESPHGIPSWLARGEKLYASMDSGWKIQERIQMRIGFEQGLKDRNNMHGIELFTLC